MSEELEDLQHLVAVPGWKRFRDMVNAQWSSSGTRYQDAITNAARATDTDAVQQLRQIISAQREITAVMGMVDARIKLLKTPLASGYTSRRGHL